MTTEFIIRILAAVAGYTVPVQEIETRLSVIAPVKIIATNIADPIPVDAFYSVHYRIVDALINRPTVILHAPFTDFMGSFLSGGKAYVFQRIATLSIVLGYDERNLAVTLHEIGHIFSLLHNETECSVMSPQPCGLDFTLTEIKKAKRAFKRSRRKKKARRMRHTRCDLTKQEGM